MSLFLLIVLGWSATALLFMSWLGFTLRDGVWFTLLAVFFTLALYGRQLVGVARRRSRPSPPSQPSREIPTPEHERKIARRLRLHFQKTNKL